MIRYIKGYVNMNALQNIYIRILTPITNKTQKVSESARNAVVFVCMLLILSTGLIRFADMRLEWGFSISETIWVTLIGGLVLIATVFSVKGRLQVLKCNLAIFIFFVAFNILIIISGFHHFIGDGIRPFSIVLLVFFIPFYFVWSNREDFQTLFRMIATAMASAGLVFIVIGMIVFPLALGGRYTGLTSNPNSIGGIAAVVLICGMYLLFTDKKLLAGLGIVTTLISFFTLFLSNSRTGMLMALFAIIICVIHLIHVFREDKEKGKEILRRVLLIVGIIAVALVFFIVVISVNSMQGSNLITRFFQGFGTASAESNAYYIINRILSGRLAIWDTYIQHLNLIGNDATYLPVYLKGIMSTAHNGVIDIAYRSGIPAGITYLGFLILSIIISARRFFSDKTEQCLLVSIAVSGFVVYGLLEPVIPMTLFSAAVLYFLVLSPLFFQMSSDKSK